MIDERRDGWLRENKFCERIIEKRTCKTDLTKAEVLEIFRFQ